jgi:hypothetical protein
MLNFKFKTLTILVIITVYLVLNLFIFFNTDLYYQNQYCGRLISGTAGIGFFHIHMFIGLLLVFLFSYVSDKIKNYIDKKIL